MGDRSKQSDSELFLAYALRMTKGRIRLISLCGSLLSMTAVAAALLLLAVVADHLYPQGLTLGARRFCRWTVVAVELTMLIGLIFYPLGRRISDLYAARLIEKAYPQFRNDLTDVLQLKHDSRVHPGVLAAIQRHTAREVLEADLRSTVSARAARLSAILCAAAAGVWLLYWLAAPKPVLPSILRILSDGEIAAPTHSRILSIIPADGSVVVTGQYVRFEAEVLRRNGPVRLKISRDGGKTFLADDEMEMGFAERTGRGKERFTADWQAGADAAGLAGFEVTCGDAPIRGGTLVVLPIPALRSIEITLAWPEYTGRGVTKNSNGHIEALAAEPRRSVPGTKVELRTQANLLVGSASLVFDNAPPIIMETNGRDMTGTFEVEGDDRYRIVYKGKYEYVRGKSIEYPIKAITDQPPTIRLSDPKETVQLSADGQLHLTGEAVDDFGLASVTLVCSDGDRQWRIELGSFAAPGVALRRIAHAMSATDIARAGQQVSCYLEARDFRPPSGQVTRSRTFEVIVNESDDPLASSEEESAELEEESSEPKILQTKLGKPITQQDQPPASQQAADLLESVRLDASRFDMMREHLADAIGGRDDEDATENDQRVSADRTQQDSNSPTEVQLASIDALSGADQAGSAQNGQSAEGQSEQNSQKSQGDGQSGSKGEEQSGDGEQSSGEFSSDSPGAGEANGQSGSEGEKQSGDGEQSSGESSSDSPGTGEAKGQEGASGESKGSDGGQTPGESPSQGKGQGQGQGEGEGQGQGQGQGKGQGQAAGGSGGEGDGKGANEGSDSQSPGAGQSGSDQSGAGGSAATGDHAADSAAGGESQSSHERGEVDSPAPDNLSPSVTRRLRSVGRIIDEADRQIRNGEIDETLLEDLGMNEAEFTSFVEAYRERFDNLSNASKRTDRASTSTPEPNDLPGDPNLRRGEQAAPGVGAIRGSEKIKVDDSQELLESRRKEVSSEFRKEVEGYFRAVSDQAVVDKPATQPAK